MAEATLPLRVSVLTPEEIVYEGDAESVIVPAWDGQLGILRGHAPLMALLGTGTLRLKRHRVEEEFVVSGGFVQVRDDHVTVLSERALLD